MGDYVETMINVLPMNISQSDMDLNLAGNNILKNVTEKVLVKKKF